MKKQIWAAFLIPLFFCSCSGKKNSESLNNVPLSEIIAKAQKEGAIYSLGMPDDWANWGKTWSELEEFYGIKHFDDDISSLEEINRMKSEGVNGKSDIGDVGFEYGQIAEHQKITLKYKTSY